MKKSIMPYILRGLSSDTLRKSKYVLHGFKRKSCGGHPTIDVFLKADDPYSYLLVQALENIEARFNVDLKYHVFQNIDPEMYPRLDMWHQYARYDAFHMAELYNYRFPNRLDLGAYDEPTTLSLAKQLVSIEKEADFLSNAKQLMEDYWFKGEVVETSPSQEQALQSELEKNQELLRQKGHYFSAMLYFEGEWYWGIDRLDHLESRLNSMGFNTEERQRIQFDRTYKDFCTSSISVGNSPQHKPLTLFWSARSPYSYIGLEQAIKLTRHHGIPLDIKPVLPMMMRGMNVPYNKKLYIFLDTKREANKQGLPYGFLADPLGAAVERCYALVDYAKEQGKYHEFLLSFARGVNAEGIRAETDRGLRKIVIRSGLDWNVAKGLIDKQSWRTWAKNNLEEMFEQGCWGVPTICYGEKHFWGQDRFGLIEKTILEELKQSTTLNKNKEKATHEH